MTLRELAKLAGVSASTVSLALRGDPRIALATRERLQKLAEEHGYRRHPMISAMASRKWKRDGQLPSEPIAFLTYAPGVPDSDAKALQGAEETGVKLGYIVQSYRLEDYRSMSALERLLRTRGVRCLILGTLNPGAPVLDFLWHNFSVVSLGTTVKDPLSFHRIRNNFLIATQRALENMQARGYHRIGVVLYQGVTPDTDYRAQKAAVLLFQHGAREQGVTCKLLEQEELDAEKALKWIKRHKLDAVLVQEISYYWSFRDAGIKIPEQLGLVALYRDEDESKWSLPVAGLDQHHVKWGAEAVNTLDNMLMRGETGISDDPRDLLIPIQFHEAESLRAE